MTADPLVQQLTEVLNRALVKKERLEAAGDALAAAAPKGRAKDTDISDCDCTDGWDFDSTAGVACAHRIAKDNWKKARDDR